MLIGGIRLAIIASKTETGWESISLRWQYASLGLLGLGHTPIDTLEPSAQADILLGEVERVMRENPETAELCIGGAVVLDSPGTRFMSNHLKQAGFAPFPALTVDYDAVAAASLQFEVKCRARCLALAQRATELDPTDVRWWRIRALLQFGEDVKPRNGAWIEVLDDCADHDPDNALYDYLAAQQFWAEGADHDLLYDDEWPEGKRRLIVKDAELFRQGIDRFERGQMKPYLAAGEHALEAVAHFLSLSQVSKADQAEQAEIATSRTVIGRPFSLIIGLREWQVVRADHARQAGDTSQQVALLRQNFRLFDQAIVPSETLALDTHILFDDLRHISYKTIVDVARENPASINPAELGVLTTKAKTLRTESKLIRRAFKKLESERNQRQKQGIFPRILAAVALASAVYLVMFAGVIALVGRLLKPQEAPRVRFGWSRHIIAWILGCGGTFVVVGMAPAQVISLEVQKFVIAAMVWGIALVIVGLAAWQVFRVLRRRKFQFSLLSLFAVMTGLAILCSMWPVIASVFSVLEAHPSERWLCAKGSSGIDAESLRIAMGVNKATWFWALLQWLLHYGPYAGLAVSLVLVAVWFAWRSSRKNAEGFFKYWTRDIRRRWQPLLTCVGTSAFIAAVCWLTVYVWTAPETVRATEDSFQYKMQYCRAPKQRWDAVQAARSELAACPEEMNWIREQVESEFDNLEP